MKRVALALAAVGALALAAPSFANDQLAQANIGVNAGTGAGANVGGTSVGTSTNVGAGAKVGTRTRARAQVNAAVTSTHDRGLHRGFTHSKHYGYGKEHKRHSVTVR